MNEALAAAQEDTQFQFFLAKLFGRFMRQTSEDGEVQGYAWRGRLYFTKFEQATETKPNPDSQHRSLPDI